MEIGKNPRMLFNVLKQSLMSESQSQKDGDTNPVHTMKYADNLTLAVTDNFETQIPWPYKIDEQTDVGLSIRQDSLVDNQPETNDSITVKTSGGTYRVTEQLESERWPYLVMKWNEEAQYWRRPQEGITLS